MHIISDIAIVVMFLLVLGILACWYELGFGIDAGCQNPLTIFTSKYSDKTFNQMMETIFTAKNFKLDTFEVSGGGWTVWIGNKYYGFKHYPTTAVGWRDAKTKTGDYSYFQKRRFFKRLRNVMENMV